MNDLNSIISQLEQQRDSIDKALAALRGISGQATPQSSGAKDRGRKMKSAPVKKQRTISEDGRRRMAEAQQKRWAAKRATAKKAAKKQTA